MAAYIVGNLTINDPATFGQYSAAIGPLIMNSGGKLLARDFEPMDLEGTSRPGLAIIEFESVEAAHSFYNSPAHQALLALRLSSAEGWLRVVPALTMPTS